MRRLTCALVLATVGLLGACTGGPADSDAATATTTTTMSTSTSTTTSGSDAAASGSSISGSELTDRMNTALHRVGSVHVTTKSGGETRVITLSTADVVYGDPFSFVWSRTTGERVVDLSCFENCAESYLRSPQDGVQEWTEVTLDSDQPAVRRQAEAMVDARPDPAAAPYTFSERVPEFTVQEVRDEDGAVRMELLGELPLDVYADLVGRSGAEVERELRRCDLSAVIDDRDVPHRLALSCDTGDRRFNILDTTYSRFGEVTVTRP